MGLYDQNWDINSYNKAYDNTNLDARFQGENEIMKYMDQDYNYRPPNSFLRSGIGTFYNTPQAPAVYPGQRNIHEGFGSADLTSTFEPPEKKAIFPSILNFAKNALNIRNPLHKGSQNYNPALEGQIEDLNKINFLSGSSGKTGPYQITGGPLAGKNLVSMFGTNDYDEMLAKKIAWFQKRKDLGKTFSQKNWDKVIAEQEARKGENTARDGDRANIEKIERYTGRPVSDYRMSRPASERQFTGHGKSGMGRDRSELMAGGGRIGYNRGRVVNPGGYQGDEFEDENTLEFMQDQGVPFSEMAEGKSPFEMRIDELMDTGMSWEEAYQIASEEFGQIAEGPEESFSEEGIASLV